MNEKNKPNFLKNLFGKKTNNEENLDVEIQRGVDSKIGLITGNVEWKNAKGFSTGYTNRGLTNEQIDSLRDKFVAEAKETWKEAAEKDSTLKGYDHGSKTVDIQIEDIASKAKDKCLKQSGKTNEGVISYNKAELSQFIEQEVSNCLDSDKNDDFEKDLKKSVNTKGLDNDNINNGKSQEEISNDDLTI